MLGIVAALCFILGAGAVTTVNGQVAGATNFKLAPNASIRLNEGSTGIRFTATMDNYDANATYGFVIVPAVYLNGITDNYVPALEAKYDTLINLKSNVVESKDGGYEIKGSIANIKYNNIDLDFVGIAYEKDANGNYAYAEFESVDAVARSVFNVASKAFNANQDSTHPDYGIYDEEEIGIITNFIDKGVAKKCGVSEEVFNSGVNDGYDYKLAFASDTLNANFGEATKFAFSSDTNLDTDTVTYLYNEEEVIVDAKNKTVTPLVTGSISIMATTVARIAEMQINVTVPEGYLATFDNKAYETLVKKADNSAYEKDVKVEYLEEYKGEKGVLKITMQHDNNHDAAWVLDLLGYYTDGYTVKYLLEDLYVGDTVGARVATIRWRPVASADIEEGGNIETDFTYDIWHTKYISDARARYKNAIGMYTFGGDGVVMYLSFVYNGTLNDYLESGLKGAELANFDVDDYKEIIKITGVTHTVEILDNWAGETGVLKVSYYHSNTPIRINLVKSHSGKFTVRYMFDTTLSQAGMLLASTSGWDNANTNKLGCRNMWMDVVVSDTASDVIAFGASGAISTPVILYVAGVYDGDYRDQLVTPIKNALAEKITEENVLADFSSDDYLSLIQSVTNGYNVNTYSAKILESYTDANGVTKNGVLELKLTFPTSGWHFVNLTLPKAYTERFTIDIAVAEGYTGQIGIGEADTGASLHANYSVVGGTAITAVNKWCKVSPSAKSFANKNEMTIGVVNQGTCTSVTIYIDCIYDGTVA